MPAPVTSINNISWETEKYLSSNQNKSIQLLFFVICVPLSEVWIFHWIWQNTKRCPTKLLQQSQVSKKIFFTFFRTHLFLLIKHDKTSFGREVESSSLLKVHSLFNWKICGILELTAKFWRHHTIKYYLNIDLFIECIPLTVSDPLFKSTLMIETLFKVFC